MLVSSSSLTYYHRLNTGGIVKGPVKYTHSVEQQKEASIESFEYCYKENKLTMTESMTNSVELSGVFKFLSASIGNETTFAEVSEEAVRTGEEIRTFQKKFVKTSTMREYDLNEDEFVATYIVVKLMCFTVNGGKKQYAHVPLGERINAPMNEKRIKNMMANQSGFLLEKNSWMTVTDLMHDVDLDDIDELKDKLVPVNFEIDPTATATVHLQGYGDKDFPLDTWAGTMGEYMRLEGFQIHHITAGLKLEYMAHCETTGSTGWTNGFVGSRGASKRLEGFAIRIAEGSVKGFSVKYSAHLEGRGTIGWEKDGAFCGTRGESLRVEAINVRIVRRVQK